MRIVEKKVAPGKTVEFGKEDILFLLIVVLILIGLGFGKLTFEEALGYLGVTSTGGVWGLLGGSASK